VSREGWNLDELVDSLRGCRERSPLNNRSTIKPAALPSPKVLTKVMESLMAALYPRRLGPTAAEQGALALREARIDDFVGLTLHESLLALRDQIRIELVARATSGDSPGLQEQQQATAITGRFAAQLPRIRTLLDSDLIAAYRGDPAAESLDEVLVCYPGVQAIIHHRFAHALHGLGAPLVARIIAEISHSATGVDIHPGASIGESFFIDHGTGVVIGGTAVIGDRVRLYQAVTLGAKSFPLDDQGVLVKGEPRHPIVEDDVVIYAGATILGRVTIGQGAQIGGNVWLTRSIAAGTTITQAKVISETFGEGSGI
jgi:serine O-acetyltransferase